MNIWKLNTILGWSCAAVLAIAGTLAVAGQEFALQSQTRHGKELLSQVATLKKEVAKVKANLTEAESKGATCENEAYDWNQAYVALTDVLANDDLSVESLANARALEQTAYNDTCLAPGGDDSVGKS